MAVFTSDTFTDTDATALTSHTGETGAAWTRRTGASDQWTISGNKLVPGNDGYSRRVHYASGTPADAEYDVEFVYRLGASIPGDRYDGLGGRVDTGEASGQGYFAVYETFSSYRRWNLYKVVAGTQTSLGTYSQTLTTDQDYAVKLEIRDATKKVYIDGVERISSSDNVITGAGRAGATQYGSGSGSQSFDTLVATDLSGGGGATPKNVFGKMLSGPFGGAI